jgi:signal peptidase II
MPDSQWKAYAVAAGVFALDRATKLLIEARVSFEDSYTVIPGFFQIVHSENRGIAFGIFNDSVSPWRTAILASLSVVCVAVVGAFLWRMRHRVSSLALYGFALVMGGAAGNLFDRVVFGRVTDFLLLYVGSYQWPTFNVADSALDIGVGLVIIDQFRKKRQAANVP